jgi:hypothetical protein
MEAILNLPVLIKRSSLSSGREGGPWQGMEALLLNLPGLMKGSSLSSGRAKAGEEGPSRGWKLY